MKNNTREYAVGIRITNTFYVEAKSQDEAEQIVREYDPYKTLKDCDFTIDYADPTSGEVAGVMKVEEKNIKDYEPEDS